MSKLFNTLRDVLTPYANKINLHTEEIDSLIDSLSEKINKRGVGEVTPQNTTFFEMSDNLLDYNNVLSGKRLNADGDGVFDASAYFTTPYINVSRLSGVRYYRHNGSSLSTPTTEYCLYDDAYTPIGRRTATNEVIDTSEATYIRVDGTDSIKHQIMLVDSSITVTSYIPYEATLLYDSGRFIHVSPTDDIIQILKDNAGKNIVFDAGNYDVISIYEAKYGNTYFENYAGYSTNDPADRGIPVGRGTKLYFDNGAVFSCNYEGSNTSVRNNFSAFAIESGVEINGLRLKSSGIRNCIHDDFDKFYNGTLPTIIRNCDLEHDRMVIAGGLAQHDIVVIKDCVFTDTFANHTTDFYYHNNENAEAQSYMVIKDCYMSKGVGIKYYGNSTKITPVVITNNSMASDVDFGPINDATNINMRVFAWNNIIRSEDDSVDDLKSAINVVESATVVYTEPTNLLHGTITSGYIINADGSITERSEYSYSDYIEIDNSKGYLAFTRQATATTRIMDSMTTAFYDVNKTFISRIGGNVKTIPSNAAYIRQNIISTYLSNVYKPMVEHVNSTGSNIASVYSDWFEPYYALLANYGANFHNKKICVYGDSLAANGNGGDNAWINILANVLDFDTAYNRGIGGSRVTDTETRYAYVDTDGDAYNRSSYTTQQTVTAGYTEINPCMSLTDRINTIPIDTDVLIILAGANDASGVTLDAIRTAYATMLDGIYARVPNARVLLGTLLYNHNWDGNENAQIVEKYNGIRSIIKDMGALYGYPVIDFKGTMGVNKLNYPEYMDSDGVHYTSKTRGKNRIVESAIPNVLDIKYVN